jgi:uncharacterized protein
MTSTLSRNAWLRIIPFAVFMVALAMRGAVPLDGSWGMDSRWLYAAQAGLVAGLLLMWWAGYGELQRQNLPSLSEWLLAVVSGLVVFAIWISLDAPWMRLDSQAVITFRPVDAQGQVLWPLVMMRWLGATLVVPVMEELFWRSFLMRWIERAQFETVDPRSVGIKAIVLSTFVFTLAHTLWLAAVVAGLAYAWLYRRTGKLWVAVIAHAITNGALGVWVVLTGNWAYW